MSFFISRKRRHIPDLRDDSDSEDLPPKRRKDVPVLPIAFRSKCQQLGEWFSELRRVHNFLKMALSSGATLPDHPIENDDGDESLDEEDDDISVQEIKSNFNPQRSAPLIKKYQNSEKLLSSPSKSSRKQLEINGAFSSGSRCSTHKVNGCSSKDWPDKYRENGNLKRSSIGSFKRGSLSNPATEIEIILGSGPELVPIEGDGIEILSESPSSKQKHASAQRSFRMASRLPAAKHSGPVMNASQSLTSFRKSHPYAPKSFTANEVVRLQEKAQYKILLDRFISCSRYKSISKKSQSDAGVQADTSSMSSSSYFQKELKQPVDTFIAKYYKPCRLLSPEKAEKPTEKKEAPPEITIDDDDDDDIQIIDVKLPELKAKYTSRYFTNQWIVELRKNLHAQTEERNKIVEDQERKLEKIKTERLLNRLRIGVPVTQAVEPEFPELTPEMEEAVDQALNTGTPEDRLVKITSDYVLRKDIETLSGLKWLNDLVINSYFDLIVERSKQESYPSVHAYNTFFYSIYKTKGYSSVRRWTRKLDIFSFDLNFVPIHLGVHWCLAVIDHRSKKICYYDSMGTGEDQCLDLLHEYLCLEYKDKKGQILDPSTYTTEIMKDIPQQMNGSDCGMFTLKYAEYISRDAEITFNQDHMQYFRRRMVYELLTSKLL